MQVVEAAAVAAVVVAISDVTLWLSPMPRRPPKLLNRNVLPAVSRSLHLLLPKVLPVNKTNLLPKILSISQLLSLLAVVVVVVMVAARAWPSMAAVPAEALE
jgi:hypothetical protein